MKVIIRKTIVVILLLSFTSCYSSHVAALRKDFPPLKDYEVVSIKTKDNRIVKNEPPVIIYNSEKGVYIIDSTGTRLLSHDNVKSITYKSVDFAKTAWFVTGAGLGIFIVYFFYELSQLSRLN